MGEKIRAAFEAQGQRQTIAKNQITERLVKIGARDADFTVEKLWHELRRTNPRLGRATVFRAVEMLVNQGLLNRIDFPDGSHNYRVCGDGHHHHITCVKCHRVVDIRHMPAAGAACFDRPPDGFCDRRAFTYGLRHLRRLPQAEGLILNGAAVYFYLITPGENKYLLIAPA